MRSRISSCSLALKVRLRPPQVKVEAEGSSVRSP